MKILIKRILFIYIYYSQTPRFKLCILYFLFFNKYIFYFCIFAFLHIWIFPSLDKKTNKKNLSYITLFFSLSPQHIVIFNECKEFIFIFLGKGQIIVWVKLIKHTSYINNSVLELEIFGAWIVNSILRRRIEQFKLIF